MSERPEWVFQMQVAMLVRGVRGDLHPEVAQAKELKDQGFVATYRVLDSVPTVTFITTPHMARLRARCAS